MKNVAEKVAEKFGRRPDVPINEFFANNQAASQVLRNVLAKANINKQEPTKAYKGGYANGGDTPTTATTTADPETVTAKTPEELAEEAAVRNKVHA